MSSSPTQPQVTVVVPTWNTRQWLAGCLNGLRAQRFQDFQVVMVDNGSNDGSVAFVEQQYPEVRVLAFGENRGFAPAVNAGIQQTRSKYVALLNADTVPDPNWLLHLVETMEKSSPEVGSLASKMLQLESPDIIDDAGDTFSWYGSARKRGFGKAAHQYTQLDEVFSACGGATLYRRSFLEDVGNFDASFHSYLEDIDLGLRGRLLGYRCLYVPTAQVLHKGQGASIIRSRYVYLMTRNRLMLLFKSIPLRLLLKHAHTLLYGQFYYFLVYKKPLYSIAGGLAFLSAIFRLLRQRRVIQRRKKISDQALEAMLSQNLGEIPLKEIIKNRLKAIKA
jgi:GT2 family glycosyltransferase